MKKELIDKIPKIKKTINAFLVGEDGKISKQSIIKAGVVLTAVSLGVLSSANAGTHANTDHQDVTPHTNNPQPQLTYSGEDSGVATTAHSHHTSHGNTAHSSVVTPATCADDCDGRLNDKECISGQAKFKTCVHEGDCYKWKQTDCPAPNNVCTQRGDDITCSHSSHDSHNSGWH